jgi:hypothetical protein
MAGIEILPRLDGRRGAVVRVVYVALAFLTTIVVAGGLIFNGIDFFRNTPASMQWGLRTFSSVEPGTPPYIGDVGPTALRGGVRLNDRFAAIEGKPVPLGTSE